ncbi:MAG: Glycosyl transferase, family 2 [Candidatus Woesebacteria bacterium GW2011_GWB1_39_10]|uniref:Glycosyl transferase, family 2 n=2 Tax=Candidatus Woeseibacteriota TaxID=1752722 RepID=A0A0G0LLA2_9BACT|nr:MAG: Glycosyl transferase, family 2 [Candidatus Woesebacteria bacterium GW2011_GWB1_39_10]KKS90807.1 MAG: Glycosyl transferase, family 2 [Candidatus Woesebacteria bacterium GW2011_GWA1_43_12]
MNNPKISVLMPVYNGEKYLMTSIESILDQTFQDFEFIIVDDDSTDDSWKIINDYKKKDKRIVALQNKINLKTSKTLNVGLSKACGKYIVRMDVDDWSYPNRLQTQYDYMEARPKVGVSGGTIEVCDKNLQVLNVREYPQTDGDLRKIIFLYSPFAHPATIWNRELLVNLRGYNENIPLSQDAELYFRLGSISKFANIKDKLVKLRMHTDSSSSSRNIIQEKYAIYARIKGIFEYGYSARLVDWLYIILRIIVMFIVPAKMKFWLFNLLRRKK